jgi:hypothetical protein
MGLGIVTAGLAVIIVQSYCTITAYELGIVLLATGVAVVIIGGIWCGEESERDVGLGIVTAGLAVTIVQSYCTITAYELGIVLLATGVAVVIIGGIWCREESERNLVEA